MKDFKAFMVCLAVSILLGISANAQQIDTLIFMVSGEQLVSFNSNNEITERVIHETNEEMNIRLESNEFLLLDLYDKRVRKNMFDKKMIREIVYITRNGQQGSEAFYSHFDGLRISGKDIKLVTIKPMIR